MGLIHEMRSRSRASRGGDGKDECYTRRGEEEAECRARVPDMAANYLPGCMERARDRFIVCLRNGYPGGPGEPPKWGDADEETWRNFGR
jgi:hypothetical protein